MQKEILKKDLAAIGEEIGQELGVEFIKAYHAKYPGDVVRYTVGRNIIDQILAQPGCVGLRFFNALNENGEKTLVYVGVDAYGKDLVKRMDVQSDGSIVASNAIVADRQQQDAEQTFWQWLISF